MASIGVRFGRALLMVRGSNGVAAAVNFYQNGLGMAVVRHTDNWAELTCPVGTTSKTTITMAQDVSEPINFHLSIQACESEAQLGVGYSPFLSLDVDNAFTRQWLDARKWVPILMDQYNIPHMEKLLLLH